jgi:hypothetical protein
MPDSRLVGARIKVDRARRHLDELAVAVREFWSAVPFRIVEEEEEASGDLITRVKIERGIPVEWGGVIGDVIHNLRSALDLVAWQLVLASGGLPDKKTAFPIRDDELAFETGGLKDLKGASPEAIRFVRGLKPYRRGNDDLWRLHRLDIIDKHRLLLPVGAAVRSIHLRVKMGVPWRDEPVVSPSFAIKPADRQFPLEDGEEVFRVKAAARDTNLAQLQHACEFEAAFGEGEVIDGEEVLSALEAMLDQVLKVVDDAEPFVAAGGT